VIAILLLVSISALRVLLTIARMQVFMEPLAKQLPGWIAEQNKAKKVKGVPDALDPALVHTHSLSRSRA
jgi:hypothetical protein